MGDASELEVALEAGYQHGQADAHIELERLRSELKQARELLRPLARHADNIEKNMDMTDVDPDTHMVAMGIWISDCFLARTFLKEHEDV